MSWRKSVGFVFVVSLLLGLVVASHAGFGLDPRFSKNTGSLAFKKDNEFNANVLIKGNITILGSLSASATVQTSAPIEGDGSGASPVTLTACAEGEIYKFISSAWTCATEGGGGLTLADIENSSPTLKGKWTFNGAQHNEDDTGPTVNVFGDVSTCSEGPWNDSCGFFVSNEQANGHAGFFTKDESGNVCIGQEGGDENLGGVFICQVQPSSSVVIGHKGIVSTFTITGDLSVPGTITATELVGGGTGITGLTLGLTQAQIERTTFTYSSKITLQGAQHNEDDTGPTFNVFGDVSTCSEGTWNDSCGFFASNEQADGHAGFFVKDPSGDVCIGQEGGDDDLGGSFFCQVQPSSDVVVGHQEFKSTFTALGDLRVPGVITATSYLGDASSMGGLFTLAELEISSPIITGVIKTTNHIEAQTGANDPGVSSCGSGAFVVGTDLAGKIAIGTGVTTSCSLSFGTSYTTNANCVASINNAKDLGVSSTFTSMTITSLVDMASDVVSYICIGR